MNKLYRIIILIISISAIFSCNSDTETKSELRDTTYILITKTVPSKEQAPTLEEDVDFVAKYVCPNHCNGSGSDKQGDCSFCGMELIENIDY